MIFIVLSILLGFIKTQQYFYVGRNDLECGIPFSRLGLEIYIIQKKPKMNLSSECVCHMSKEEMLAQMSSGFFFVGSCLVAVLEWIYLLYVVLLL